MAVCRILVRPGGKVNPGILMSVEDPLGVSPTGVLDSFPLIVGGSFNDDKA